MARLLISKPIGRGIARAESVLFKPFVRRKWLTLGVAAWLGAINEWRGLGATLEAVLEGIAYGVANPDAFAATMRAHRGGIIAGLVGASVVLFGVYLVFRWLNCRGQFMLLDGAVNGGIEPRESFRRHKGMGNSLLRFRIGWDLIVFNLFLLVMVVAAALVWPDFRPMLGGEDYRVSGWTWAAVFAGGIGLFCSALFAVLGAMFIDYLVVPVMFVLKLPAGAAFRHAFGKMFRGNVKGVLGFLVVMTLVELFHLVVVNVAIVVMGICTLGVGIAMMAVPLVAVLPLYPVATMALAVDVFSRSSCLYFIEQFGAEYCVEWKGGGLVRDVDSG